MIHGYTVAQIRSAEAVAMDVLGPDVLMQRAAAGLATATLRRLRPRAYGARVLLVVGSGNNGGDALYAGVRLAGRGVAVTAWRTATAVHDAGWRAFLAAGGREVDAGTARALLGRQALVVDAVAGIGSRPGLEPAVADFAGACAALSVPVVAVDLPSGVAPEPPFSDEAHFTADLTVTFGGYKLCQLLEPGRSACGEVELVDIGLELPQPAVSQWTDADLAEAWPVPDASSDKYSRGVVGLDTGSVDYPGAAVLTAAGAVGAGAGMVRYLGPLPVAQRVLDRFPNVVIGQGRVQALVVGSGWGQRKDHGVVARAIAARVPLVVDADGLRHLPAGGGHRAVVLTPHAGELARLLDLTRAEVEADPLAAVRAAVATTGCTVLLKGATQYVGTPGVDRVWVGVPGPGWTAQAGSGDVLAGICGTLLAAGLDPPTAALAAASGQAMAARHHPGPLPPHRLAEGLVTVVRGILEISRR
ncbi:MAG: bifunctional ADP-dependent NAD(P)H-hydrate dehydratase/NAD(P)H-hydrate epimerase [Propionicimonas sp.]